MSASPMLLSDGERGSIRIEGRVIFHDGEPFSGATLTVTELRGRLFMMPAVKQKIRVVADHDGSFGVDLTRVRGFLDIRAQSDSCVWASSSVVQLNREDLRGKDKVWVDLEATRGEGACPELEDDPEDAPDDVSS